MISTGTGEGPPVPPQQRGYERLTSRAVVTTSGKTSYTLLGGSRGGLTLDSTPGEPRDPHLEKREKREKRERSRKKALVGIPTHLKGRGTRRYTPCLTMGRWVLSVSVPADETDLVRGFESLAKLERTTVSDLIRAAMKEYLAKHKEGNPQRPLIAPRKSYPNPAIESARDHMHQLQELVRLNPGWPLGRLTALFTKETGLRRETVREYVQVLQVTKSLRLQGDRVYPA